MASAASWKDSNWGKPVVGEVAAAPQPAKPQVECPKCKQPYDIHGRCLCNPK